MCKSLEITMYDRVHFLFYEEGTMTSWIFLADTAVMLFGGCTNWQLYSETLFSDWFLNMVVDLLWNPYQHTEKRTKLKG